LMNPIEAALSRYGSLVPEERCKLVITRYADAIRSHTDAKDPEKKCFEIFSGVNESPPFGYDIKSAWTLIKNSGLRAYVGLRKDYKKSRVMWKEVLGEFRDENEISTL
jgi:hypothetical protein